MKRLFALHKPLQDFMGTRVERALPRGFRDRGKMKDKATAKQAYQKYIELAPDGKETERLKKRVVGKS